MSESKHTPGPWDPFTQPSFSGWWAVRDNNWNEIGSGDGGFTEADARLIAAAPELLEALILMVRTHDEPAESMLQEMREQKWLEQARAAIAKATGSSEATE
jgi:hypothetical protein